MLYICGRPKDNPEREVVLKMAKVKTLEYKIVKEGIKCLKSINYLNNEESRELIKTFEQILPTLKLY